MPDMINVGIAGSVSWINRNIETLSKIRDVRVTGIWVNGDPSGIADQLKGLLFSDPEKIIERSDTVIFADNCPLFSRLTVIALRKARHVFLYPSFIRSQNEVYQLIKLAREANVILKCGRIGENNLKSLIKILPHPDKISIIELQHTIRLSQNTRSSVIAENILADMEIITQLIKARNTTIKAKGLSILSSQPEILNVRLEFDNSGIVNYLFNNLGIRNEHFLNIFMTNSVLNYSIIKNEFSGWTLKDDVNVNENPIFIENIQVEQTDCFFDDLCGFISLIHSGPAFLSIYDNGFESFVLTDRILDKVSKTLVQFA